MTRIIKYRALVGFENESYVVGSDGSVHGKKPLKQFLNEDGYPSVTLVIRGKHFRRRVHRLVAEAFIENTKDKPQVNHKNGVRTDNRVENLEWVTSRENTIDGRNRGRKITDKHRSNGRKQFGGENNPKAKMTVEDISLIRTHRRLGQSLKWISSIFNISIAQVSAICTNRNWK